MIRLRRYNKERDGEIFPSFDGLYVEFDNDYLPVEVIATGLKGEPGDILIKFMYNEEDIVRRRDLNGHCFFIKDDNLEFEEDDFVTCGYKTKDGRWYKWVMCIKFMDNAPVNYKLFYGLDGNNGATKEVRINGYSNAQEWVRPAEDGEIELLRENALKSPEKCIVDMAKLIFLKEPEYKFKPFDKVLMRDDSHNKWRPFFFSNYTDDEDYPYKAIGESGYSQCIPYEGNEDLCLTTNKPE